MITLEESKERLLLEIQKAAHHYKQKKGNDSIESYQHLEAYKKLMECYVHTSELPVSDIVFTWYRLNMAISGLIMMIMGCVFIRLARMFHLKDILAKFLVPILLMN
jgi:hypothetical protein